MDRKYAELSVGPSDLLAVRFGISPGHELVQAVRALLRPQYSPVQRAWRRDIRRPLPEEAMRLLAVVCGADGSSPDFLTAPPYGSMTPDEEVARLRAVPLERIGDDLMSAAIGTSGIRREMLDALVSDPERARRSIAHAWQQAWDALLGPFWPQMLRLLRADVAVRARRISETGMAEMANQLHSTVSWSHEVVKVELSQQIKVESIGRGLVLVPSVMHPPCGCAVLIDDSAPPTIFYPASGVTDSWYQDRKEVAGALSALLGAARANILLGLQQPLSTSECAVLTELAVSTASHHLSVLRSAGLIDSRRHGVQMLHSRTPMGEALIGA